MSIDLIVLTNWENYKLINYLIEQKKDWNLDKINENREWMFTNVWISGDLEQLFCLKGPFTFK